MRKFKSIEQYKYKKSSRTVNAHPFNCVQEYMLLAAKQGRQRRELEEETGRITLKHGSNYSSGSYVAEVLDATD